MKTSEFYNLGEKHSQTTLQVHSVSLSNGFDDVIRLLIGDHKGISYPVIFKQKYGTRTDDIIRTGTAILFLISDKMRSVLEDNQFTGWKTFEVKILDKENKEITGYHGLSITGRCGPIDYNKSEIIEKRTVPGGPLNK